MSKITLKLEKLTDLLRKYRYILVSAYCDEGDIRFVEIRTPKYQKTFIVFIPPSYSMKCGSNMSIKQVDIIPSKENPTDRQINFMSDMKGPLLECDLLSISSISLCMYKNSGKMQCYKIKGAEEEEPDEIEEETDEEETDEITALEKDTARVLQKIDPKNKLVTPKIKEQTSSEISQGTKDLSNGPKKTKKTKETTLSTPEINPDDNLTEEQIQQQELLASSENKDGAEEKVVEEKIAGEEGETTDEEGESTDGGESTDEGETTDEDATELVFEDEEGNVIEEVEGTLNTTGDIKEKGVESANVISTGDNSVPEDLEDLDISLGIIYTVIAIGSFFKKIDKYEENIVEIYEQLDDNELDVRKESLIRLKDATADFLEQSEKRMKEINSKEVELKADLLRLTVILAQANAMKAEIASNEKQLSGETPAVEKIYIQTRKNVHDINLELLRLRDQANEILANYFLSIKELMDL